MENQVILGNCLEVMKDLPEKSIDLILVDPPFGTTPLDWDKILDFKNLWEQYNRIIQDNGVILIFGQEPFSSFVRLSNIKDYKYDWYWVKERLTNVFQVKRRPGKVVETISVFYKNQSNYFPQKSKFLGKKVTNKIGENARWSETMAGKTPTTKPFEYIDNGTRHPTQILEFNRDNNRKGLHPTQKPIALLEYLIKTYTTEKDTILDSCAGSGSTLIAAKNLNRNFIGIEKEEKYYNIIKERLENSLI